MKKIILILFAATALSACKDNKIIDVKSRIRFINASAIQGDVNLFIDYQKIYETNVQYLNYSKFREFLTAKRRVQIRNAADAVIIDTAIDLEANKAYSIVLYDSMNTTRYKQVKEELITPVGSTCKIRFAHLSNDAAMVNVTRDEDTTKHFINFENGNYSEYQAFNSGAHYFKVTGSNVNYIQGVKDLKPGNFYTMYLKGNVNSSGVDSVGIFTIENNGNYD